MSIKTQLIANDTILEHEGSSALILTANRVSDEKGTVLTKVDGDMYFDSVYDAGSMLVYFLHMIEDMNPKITDAALKKFFDESGRSV